MNILSQEMMEEENRMINREDMLELTRRLTSARTNLVRLAGAYIDEEGYIDGTFNTHFLKLSAVFGLSRGSRTPSSA